MAKRAKGLSELSEDELHRLFEKNARQLCRKFFAYDRKYCREREEQGEKAQSQRIVFEAWAIQMIANLQLTVKKIVAELERRR
jgi:hypothetical protein